MECTSFRWLSYCHCHCHCHGILTHNACLRTCVRVCVYRITPISIAEYSFRFLLFRFFFYALWRRILRDCLASHRYKYTRYICIYTRMSYYIPFHSIPYISHAPDIDSSHTPSFRSKNKRLQGFTHFASWSYATRALP